MKVSFRADASIDMGTGHVMRCLTLAHELGRQGAECTFITRAHPGNMAEVMEVRVHRTHLLPKSPGAYQSRQGDVDHASWLGVSWEQDAEETVAAIGVSRPDWLIVDHYSIDARWHKTLRDHVGRIMVIDDLADRAYDCDLLLDQNLGREARDYAGLVPDHCRVLVDPKYALLRPEFAALRDYSLRRREKPQIRQLLITMGGVDKDNATGQVLEGLKSCQLPADCRTIIVMGQNAPWLDSVQRRAESLPWHTAVLVGINDMAQRMADSDLAIGAAGATSWERCCLGLPALVIVLAKNQEAGARYMVEAGMAESIPLGTDLATNLQLTLEELVAKPERLTRMSEKARKVTKGDGAQWLVRLIFEGAKSSSVN